MAASYRKAYQADFRFFYLIRGAYTTMWGGGIIGLFGTKTIFTANRVRRILTTTAALSAIVAALTLYGQNVGNFVTQVDSSSRNRGITLSSSPNFEYQSSRIIADPISNIDNITLCDIPNFDIIHDGGQHNGDVGNFLGLTFYIKNIGTEVVNYQYAISITGLYKAVDEAIRVAIVVDDEVAQVYSKGEYNPESGVHDPEETYRCDNQVLIPATTTPFLSDRLIVSNQVSDFLVGEFHKYTILIWLEGNDPDCVDDIMGGSIKLVMTYKIV